MNNQTNRQLTLNEILSYFEKEDLQIPTGLAENLNNLNNIIEVLNAYKLQIKDVLDKNTLYFQRLEVFLQLLNDITKKYIELDKIRKDIAEDYSKISQILKNISDLVVKIPYVTKVKTSLFGDRVWGTEKLHFYIINQKELFDFLNNTKNLVLSVDTHKVQNSPFTEKLNQIIEILPLIRSEYLPNVVYANVPESFKQIILLGKELKKLFTPFTFLEELGSLKELMERISNEFNKIENYFKSNPNADSIKLKGKFRKTKSSLNKLYRALSFNKYFDLY